MCLCKAILRWVFLVPSFSVFGQQAFISQYEDLDNAQFYVEELEREYGQNSLALAEPLSELAGLYTQHGRYEDAHRSIDRATLIIRRVEGLYTREQIPYLQQKIENFAASFDWVNAREQMEHIYWFYLQKSQIAAPDLTEDLLHLSDMHIRGANEDSVVYQSYHLRRAMTLNWAALAVAEKMFTAKDQRLVAIIYKLLKQYHLQLVAVRNGGSLGYQLREIYPGSNIVRSRSDTRKYFYYMGRRLLNQLAAIYSGPDSANFEAQAMVSLYVADWQVIFGRHAEALQTYQDSFDELTKISVERASSLFESPRLIPVRDFHDSIEGVIEADESAGSLGEGVINGNSRPMVFLESGAGFPNIGQSSEFSMADDILLSRALFKFDLPKVADNVSRRSRNRKTPFGKPVNAKILELDGGGLDQREIFENRIQDLSFRPKILMGVPQATEITLEYKMFSKLKN